MEIRGEMGRSIVDAIAEMAIRALEGLWLCHCFIWFVVCGGSVIVAQYASRK